MTSPAPAGLEELWSGITFDPEEAALSWTPGCPVAAVAELCQKGEADECDALPHASKNVTREKVRNTYVIETAMRKIGPSGLNPNQTLWIKMPRGTWLTD